MIGLIIILILTIFVYLYRNNEYFNKSVKYYAYRRKIDRMFKNLSDQNKRDMWLYSVLEMDDSKWYNRALERHIREKYIEPIISQYGKI